MGKSYTYTITSVDPEGDDIVEYIVNWGDGPDETLSGPFPSGSPQSKSHTWTSQGTFIIKAKAIDINGGESDWSEFSVTIPRDKSFNSPFIQISPSMTSRGLLWDNGDPDFFDGCYCQRNGFGGWSDTAEDFHLSKKSTIETVVWETGDETTYLWEGLADLVVYEYTANGPGEELVKLFEISSTREYLGDFYGLLCFRYTIDLIGQDQEFALTAGDYYILLRPYTAGTVGQSYWLTSPAPPGSKSVCYFRSNYWGYPNWISILDAFGFVYDVNFKLYGTEKSSKVLNRPIINFLQQHPNMFLVLQKLIQNLGL